MKDDLDRIMAVMGAAFGPAHGEGGTPRQGGDLLLGRSYYRLIGAAGQVPEPGEDAAGFSLSRHGFGEEELLLFAIAPEHRRKGLGKALLANFSEDARARGADRLLLEMRRGNPAEFLYRQFGFAQIGLRPDYYRTPDGKRIDAITFAFDFAAK